MARERKILALLNDNIMIPFTDAEEINGACSIQYGVGGTGTFVLEVSNQPTVATFGTSAEVDEWVALLVTNQTTGVTSLATITAVGYYTCELIGVRKIRVRCTVPGSTLIGLTADKC